MSTPWFPLYAPDFLASTMPMPPEVVGGYIRLLCYAWLHGSIPDDLPTIQRIAGGLTEDGWRMIRERLEPVGDRDGDRHGDRPHGWVHPRMERERARAETIRDARREAAERTNQKRRGGDRPADRDGDRNGHRNGERSYPQPQPQPQPQINPPPTPRDTEAQTATRTIGGGKKAVREWKPDRAMAERFAKATPAWATKLERAEAGDLFRKLDDGSRFPVTVDEVLADAVADATERICTERATVIAKVEAKGLTPDEAHELWWRWWRDHTQGGDSPTVSLRNDLADKAVRNIAAVWRGRIAAEEFATAS